MTGTYQEALAGLGTTYAIFTVGFRGLAVVGMVLIIDSHASFLSHRLSKFFSNVEREYCIVKEIVWSWSLARAFRL